MRAVSYSSSHVDEVFERKSLRQWGGLSRNEKKTQHRALREFFVRGLHGPAEILNLMTTTAVARCKTAGTDHGPHMPTALVLWKAA